MQYVGYNFVVTGDEILFDSELNASEFLEMHGIEEDTLFYIENREGQLVLVVYYDDDDEGDPVYETEERAKPSSNNILDLKYYARRYGFA